MIRRNNIQNKWIVYDKLHFQRVKTIYENVFLISRALPKEDYRDEDDDNGSSGCGGGGGVDNVSGGRLKIKRKIMHLMNFDQDKTEKSLRFFPP